MKIRVWVVTTCIPGEAQPCMPDVFASEEAAEAYADQMMRLEWEATDLLNDQDDPIPYPGNWREAQDAIIADCAGTDGEKWGQWQITGHEVEIGRLVAVVEGGMLSAIVTDGSLAGQTVETIDYDVDGADKEEVTQVRQSDGRLVPACIGTVEIGREKIEREETANV